MRGRGIGEGEVEFKGDFLCDARLWFDFRSMKFGINPGMNFEFVDAQNISIICILRLFPEFLYSFLRGNVIKHFGREGTTNLDFAPVRHNKH